MWIDLLLATVLIVCVTTDLLHRKIYNAVIGPALVLALAMHLAAEGWQGLLVSSTGFAVGLGVLLVPYLLGGMGAGDVKLLALIGALKGTGFVLETALYMALLGGLIALGVLLCRKEAFGYVRRLLYIASSWRYGCRISAAPGEGEMTATYPYGVAIAGGAAAALLAAGSVLP